MRIECIMTIVKRGKGRTAAQIFRDNQVAVQMLTHGHGTATSEIMDFLGLDEPEKDIVVSMVPESRRYTLLSELTERMNLKKPGTGIAFSIVLTGINIAASNRIGRDKEETYIEKRGMEMHLETGMELIVTVVDAGTTDIVVNAARAVGVSGGTVMKAHEVCSETGKKVFGIPIESEKEIVLMLVHREEKQTILKEICTAVYRDTGNQGISFSLPVSDAVGLSSK